MYALFVQLLTASSVLPVFVYWTSKNAIVGKSSYTVTETDFLSAPAFPSMVSRSPFSESVFYGRVFLRGQDKFGPDLTGGGQRLRGGEGPNTVSLLSKRAITRLRRWLSNSTRRLAPCI